MTLPTVETEVLSYDPKTGWRVLRAKRPPEGISMTLPDPVEGERRIAIREVRAQLGSFLVDRLTPRRLAHLLNREDASLSSGGKVTLPALEAVLLVSFPNILQPVMGSARPHVEKDPEPETDEG